MVTQTIRLYLVLSFFESLGMSFVASSYAIFLMSFGLNLLEINLINMCFFLFLFLAEIPTGLVADVFGRKLSYVLSCFIFGAGMLVYSFAETIVFFLLAEAIAAVGRTLATGAFQAWMIDRINHYGGDVEWDKVFSWQGQVQYAGMISGAVIGAWIAEYHMGLQWFVGGCVLCVVGVLAFFLMKEEYFISTKKVGETYRRLRETFCASRKIALNNKAIRFILGMSCVQAFVVMAPNMQWQPYFLEYIPSEKYLGFIFAGSSLALWLGARWSLGMMKRSSSPQKAILKTQALLGAGILFTVVSWEVCFALSAFFVHEIARGMYKPLKDVYLNENIKSQERATLISFESMMAHFGGILGLVFSGYIAVHFSITVTWCVVSCLLLLCVLWYAIKK